MLVRPRRIAVSDLRRWTFFLCIAVSFLAILEYHFLFNRHTFKALPAIVFPPKSFHPEPYPTTPHGLEAQDKKGKDWWHWDTPTRFRAYEKSGEEEVGCDNFPKELLRKIQVVLQVSVADDPRRTKAQLASVVRCIDNLLVVSDKNYTYGDSNHQAIDVLASLPAETYLKEDDYAIYDTQKKSSGKHLEQSHEVWKVDKYKFLPGVEYAVEQRPAAEWFIFLGLDTYIFWDNVFRLLENYDHTLPYYFGSPSPGRKPPDSKDPIWYAYNGPGYILSHAAAHRLVDRQKNSLGIKGPRLSEEYKQDIRTDCCGDSILGWALHDKAAVSLSGLWPMFNPHSLAGTPFGSGKRYWCEPVIGLHKTPPAEMEKLWQWEMKRDRSKRALLYADLIDFTNLGRLTRRLDWDAADWDGFAPPDHHGAHTDLHACAEACEEETACYQWTFHGQHCHMSRSIRLGHRKVPDKGKHGVFEGVHASFTTGWDIDKIRRYKHQHRCEDGPHWVKPSIKRRY